MPGFGTRVAPVDAAVAKHLGRMGAIRSVPVIDALLAATAMLEGLTPRDGPPRGRGGIGLGRPGYLQSLRWRRARKLISGP